MIEKLQLIRAATLTLIILLIGGLFLLWPANLFDLKEKEVAVPLGASALEVQKELISKGILPRYTSFYQLLRLIRLDTQLKAGSYLFSPADSLFKIAEKLIAGDSLPVKELRVTFPEGSSIYRMGLILKAHGYPKWREFQELSHEGITAILRSKHWELFKFIPTESLEGYLFPDTYRFNQETSLEALVELMLARFTEVVFPLTKKTKSSLSLHELITLASIVEKEAKIEAERAVIASVFYNRLAKNMPLAADPTIKYALERPTKKVYLDQLSVNSPYNTYKRIGLPPGPICNPGVASIKAVLYPAKTALFFFVAKTDGTHLFSRTWEEHQRAREKLQKER